MLCFEFWLLFPSLFCCSSSCAVCLTAAQTGKVARKKKKASRIPNSARKTHLAKRKPSFRLPLAYFPRQENSRQKTEINSLQSTERILQSLSLTEVVEEHSTLGLKFTGMFSHIDHLNRTVENMHKHTLCKLFMLLAEIICTLERGKRYLYLPEHNYWINPPSLAKIKDSLSLPPHSLEPEEISVRKRKIVHV